METLDEKNNGGMSEKAFHDLTGTAQWLKISALVYMGIMGLYALLLLYVLTKGATQVLIPLVFVGLAIAFNLLLLRQGNALAAFGTSRSANDIEEFAKNFKTYWTIAGVLAIIGGVLFLIGILLGGSALMNGRMF